MDEELSRLVNTRVALDRAIEFLQRMYDKSNDDYSLGGLLSSLDGYLDHTLLLDWHHITSNYLFRNGLMNNKEVVYALIIFLKLQEGRFDYDFKETIQFLKREIPQII